jgi:hypothetical protein
MGSGIFSIRGWRRAFPSPVNRFLDARRQSEWLESDAELRGERNWHQACPLTHHGGNLLFAPCDELLLAFMSAVVIENDYILPLHPGFTNIFSLDM